MTKPAGRHTVVIVDDEAPARKLLRYLVAKEPDFEIVAEASSGSEAIEMVRATDPDILLLDIQMPGIDGFEVIRRLGAATPLVVFVTAYHEYALKAFEVYALDYILKPPIPARFVATMARARLTLSTERRGVQRPRLSNLLRDIERRRDGESEMSQTPQEYLARLTVRDRSGIRVIGLDKVAWIEAADHFAYVYFAGSKYLIEKSLAVLEGQLDPSKFLRIRRNIIVNLAAVEAVRIGRFGALTVQLRDGVKFTTSRLLTSSKRQQLIMRCEIKTR